MNCNDTDRHYRQSERFAPVNAVRTPALVVTMIFAILANMAMATPEDFRNIQEIGEGRTFVTVEPNDDWQPAGFADALILRAAPVEQGPAIDGYTDDRAWDGAVELTVPLAWGGVREATLKAIYTKEEIFIAVSWPDSTRDDQHHPWVWDTAKGHYKEGSQVEDSLIVSIEGGCDWNASLLANQIYDFDAWLWLAARTNPLGQAVDADGNVQNRWVPNQGYIKYQSRYTEPMWNVKFIDQRGNILTQPWQGLERMYKQTPPEQEIYIRYQPDGYPPPMFAEQIAPPSSDPVRATNVELNSAFQSSASGSQQVTVPQYRPVRLTGDAGEVAAKGRWEDGRWTVELRRALVTEARTSSDSLFERTTQFSIHIFDHVERLDEASESGRLFLQFEAAGNNKAADKTTLVIR